VKAKTQQVPCPNCGTEVTVKAPFILASRDVTRSRGRCPKCKAAVLRTRCWMTGKVTVEVVG
jgi:endogenous inhibitor of DNA gyrase (YacG/DUF329 family)